MECHIHPSRLPGSKTSLIRSTWVVRNRRSIKFVSGLGQRCVTPCSRSHSSRLLLNIPYPPYGISNVCPIMPSQTIWTNMPLNDMATSSPWNGNPELAHRGPPAPGQTTRTNMPLTDPLPPSEEAYCRAMVSGLGARKWICTLPLRK